LGRADQRAARLRPRLGIGAVEADHALRGGRGDGRAPVIDERRPLLPREGGPKEQRDAKQAKALSHAWRSLRGAARMASLRESRSTVALAASKAPRPTRSMAAPRRSLTKACSRNQRMAFSTSASSFSRL